MRNILYSCYLDLSRALRFQMLKQSPSSFISPSRFFRSGECTGKFRHGKDHTLFDAESGLAPPISKSEHMHFFRFSALIPLTGERTIRQPAKDKG